MKSTARIALLALLASGLVATGCGGGDGSSTTSTSTGTSTTAAGDPEAAYADELRGALTPLGDVLTQIGAAAQSAQSTDEITSSLSDAQDAVNEASQTISDIDAPADLEDENADLVAALDGFEQALADAQAVVESGDAQAVNQLVSKAQAFAGKIGQIQQRLVDAGVELNPGGG